MIHLTSEQLEYIRARVKLTLEEINDLRQLDNLLEHCEPEPSAVIKDFDFTADHNEDYGDMVHHKFRAVYYKLLASELSAMYNEVSEGHEKDALLFQERYIAFLKTLQTETK